MTICNNIPQKKGITALLWIMLLDHTSLNVTFPVLTLLFFDAQTSLFSADTSHAVRSMWYGLCIAIPHVINIVFTPILSALSDEFGRKKILLVATFGAVLFALTAALGVLWGGLSLLFFGFVIRGMFSRTNPIAQAVIGDISNNDNKVLQIGYLQAAISIGALLGPLIGGYFANRFLFSAFNFSLPFFIAAWIALLSFIVTLFFQETHIERRKQWHLRKPFRLPTFSNVTNFSSIFRISIVLLLSQISWSLYYQFIPPILKTELNFNANQLGLFVGLIALWLALATVLGIRILQRYITLQQMLFISLCTVFLGTVATLFAITTEWPPLIWLSAIPTAIGDVIAYSCLVALYSNIVAQSDQGKIMGICFIIVAITWALTALLGGALMSLHHLLPLVLAPVGIVLAIGYLLQMRPSLVEPPRAFSQDG